MTAVQRNLGGCTSWMPSTADKDSMYVEQTTPETGVSWCRLLVFHDMRKAW